MKIALGSDHAGYEFKERIKQFLTEKQIEFKDFGAFSTTSVDYPDFAHPTATAVESKEFELGILLCGTGNGVAITANKHQKIRAGLAWNVEVAKLIKQHNNANILVIPARFVDEDLMIKIVETFLNEAFEGGRHQRRVDKIACT